MRTKAKRQLRFYKTISNFWQVKVKFSNKVLFLFYLSKFKHLNEGEITLENE